MFTLQKIFADGALFQANAALEIRGKAGAGAEITGVITKNGETVYRTAAAADGEGQFLLTLQTPEASFAPCEITLTCSCGAEYIMHDILFGELWLASGQSNMELPNAFMTDQQKLYDEIRDFNIRVYDVPPLNCGDAFPFDPNPMQNGFWVRADDADKLRNVSAMGLKFSAELYSWLNRNAEVPVGFLNASYGGTPILAWLPKDAVDADQKMKDIFGKFGKYPTPETWNTCGDVNFQQGCCQYNAKIAPLEGVKVRGVIWYQGENETGGEFWHRTYADSLRFYHKTYAERFGAEPDSFMMVSSLIYPWTYGGSGECNVGYINNAFIETALEAPEKFIAVPICDLPPSWACVQGNHPIHPTNKYPLAVRTASLVLDNVYGRSDGQLSPAFLKSWSAEGGRIHLEFDSVGFGLYLDGTHPIGLYVAGDDNIYLPAECEISADGCSMDVWCDAIPEPKNAAYSIQSLEPCCNIWGGLYPLYPFYTDKVNYINIEARPWYDTSRTAMWGSRLRGDILDLFYRPVWHPDCGSEVCPDTAFTLEGQSIRVAPEDGESADFGCYIKSYPYNKLDLQKFGKLSVNLYHTGELAACLFIEWNGGGTDICLNRTETLTGGWARYEAVLTGIPEDAEIRKVTFSFHQEKGALRFVNLEKVRLWK
ncbi:MAG: sialate O-acetylesterase [Ruminococcaceae bacterium]|nr:sialate O-acetylesterase [Oscillospiraceae bacterium]